MRVISGTAKGRKLKRVPGDTTRPITDRVKESLFNIIGSDVVGARWLDLFAGTGQVGIEALSRGAASVVFVDNAVPALRTIRENLRLTDLGAGAKVIRGDAFGFLRSLDGEPFDLIYVAPPQYRQLWERALRTIAEEPDRYLLAGGLVVAQIHPREYADLELPTLRLVDQRQYGSTMLCFYRQPDSSD